MDPQDFGSDQAGNESYTGGTSEISESPGPELTYADEQSQPEANNPAWAEYLNEIPEGYRGLVGEQFKKWDANVTQRFQKLHQDYEPLKAYEPFAQNNVQPQMLQAGLALVQRLQEDPQRFYQQLGEHFGLSPQEVAEIEEEVEEEIEGQEGPYGDRTVEDPRIAQMAQQQEYLMQQFQAEQQQKMYERVEQETDAEIASFRESHPDITDGDMTPILRIVAMGLQQDPNYSFEDAYATYIHEYNLRGQNRPGNNAPRVISANGQPGQPPQPKFADLEGDQRKALIVEDLKRAFNQT